MCLSLFRLEAKNRFLRISETWKCRFFVVVVVSFFLKQKKKDKYWPKIANMCPLHFWCKFCHTFPFQALTVFCTEVLDLLPIVRFFTIWKWPAWFHCYCYFENMTISDSGRTYGKVSEAWRQLSACLHSSANHSISCLWVHLFFILSVLLVHKNVRYN